jgi:hypothetical protein
MKKYILLSLLICFGCSIKNPDVKFDKNDINKIVEGADSEAWCEVVYCVNGPGYTGPIKLQTFRINGEAQKVIVSGISSDSQNEYKKVKRRGVNNIKYDVFIKKLVDTGIFNMNSIDLEKLPAKENAANPWEDSFTKFPRITNFIMFYYYIRIGKEEHSFNGFDIDIFKDNRYRIIVEIFNGFFGQRLGGLKFDKLSN